MKSLGSISFSLSPIKEQPRDVVLSAETFQEVSVGRGQLRLQQGCWAAVSVRQVQAPICMFLDDMPLLA